jgi:hypothetical protein
MWLSRRTAAAGLLLIGLLVSTAACSSSGGGSPTKSASARVPSSPPTTSATAAASSATSAPGQSGLSGTWTGKYSGAFQGTFKLSWQQSGSQLSGTIALSSPPDNLTLNGTVVGGKIRFGTVGSAAITYSGTVSGSSMSGTYQVQSASGGPWSATKQS